MCEIACENVVKDCIVRHAQPDIQNISSTTWNKFWTRKQTLARGRSSAAPAGKEPVITDPSSVNQPQRRMRTHCLNGLGENGATGMGDSCFVLRACRGAGFVPVPLGCGGSSCALRLLRACWAGSVQHDHFSPHLWS